MQRHLDLPTIQITVFTVMGLGQRPKPVGQKSRNRKAEIFRQKAENHKAENTIRPKNYSPILTFYYFLAIALF